MAPAPSPQSLQSDADLESSTSGDSGRGASEEGESQHVDDHGGCIPCQCSHKTNGLHTNGLKFCCESFQDHSVSHKIPKRI